MLFRDDILQGIAAGRVTLAFRRWRKPPPIAGSTLRSPIGVLSLDRVTVIEEGDITADDIGRTGMTAGALRASIAGDGTLIRIELRLAGDDPRSALREQLPSPDELAAIAARLARAERAAGTAWTKAYLQVIADQPAVVSRVLAARTGEALAIFKRRVRHLKELGLTESLEVGYRISPRGRQVLTYLAARATDRRLS